MRRLLTVLLSCFVLCSLFASAQAETRQLTAKLIAPNTPMIATRLNTHPLTGGVEENCILGVDNPEFVIQDFLFAPEGYKVAVDPTEQCLTCPLGFKVTDIHIALQVNQPCSIVLSTDLEDALFPDGADCPEPGVVDCFSQSFQVDLPGAGLFDVSIPIDCPCAYKEYTYFIGVFIESYSCQDGSFIPELVTNNTPHACANYNNFGEGWVDLVSEFPTWPGDVLIWANSECCDQPVGAESKSWGAIKGLYRD